MQGAGGGVSADLHPVTILHLCVVHRKNEPKKPTRRLNDFSSCVGAMSHYNDRDRDRDRDASGDAQRQK